MRQIKNYITELHYRFLHSVTNRLNVHQVLVFNSFIIFFISESHFQRGELLQDQEPLQRWHVSCREVYQQAKVVSVHQPLDQFYRKWESFLFKRLLEY